MESKIWRIEDGDPSPGSWKRYKNIQAKERSCEGCDLGEGWNAFRFIVLTMCVFWCTDDDRVKSLYELFLKLGKNVSGVYPLNLVIYVAILVFCHPFWWMSLFCVSGIWTVCFLLVSCKPLRVGYFSAWHQNKVKTINQVFHTEVNGSSRPPP